MSICGCAKVERQGMNKEPIKTWSRDCTIVPEFIGATFLVHNGKTFIKVYVHRRHGRAQARRVLPDPDVQGPHRRQEGSGRGAPGGK